MGWCGWFGLVRGWCANHFPPLMRFYALSEVCVCEYLKNLILSCGLQSGADVQLRTSHGRPQTAHLGAISPMG
eukprot:COSAG01_NODE_146_length_24099_cov_25.341208_12_plen_73_part_00